jgi:hypothetical protein
METEDRLERLIQSKAWSDLLEGEKEFVLQELGSEASYHAFRKTHLAMATFGKAKLLPDPRVLASLQSKMKQHHEQVSFFNRVFLFKVPAYAVVVLIGFISFFAWLGRSHPQSMVTESPVIQKDTVYIASAPDTVYLTKVIYRNVYREQKAAVISVVENSDSGNMKSSVGVSMKEKEELYNLLVSGSE